MTNQEYNLFIQSSRKVFVRLLILDKNHAVLKDVTGHCVGGNYSIDEKSAVRVTCNVDFELINAYLPSSTSPFWVNKRFRLFMGVEEISTHNIIWFKIGIFCIKDNGVHVSSTGNKISISGLDLMALQSGDVSGTLRNAIAIEANTNIGVAIQNTMNELGYETRFVFETTDKLVPYKLEMDAGSTVWDVVEKLTNLYMRWQLYYNPDGYAVFVKKRILTTDPIVWDFSSTKGLILSVNSTFNMSNVKNHIVVWGKLLDDNSQPMYEIFVRNVNYPDCPFTLEKLDEGYLNGSSVYVDRPRTLTIKEDSYYEVAQCQSRCLYEVDLHTNMAETIDLTCVPIYGITVGCLIYLNLPEDGIVGKYAVTNVSCDLKFNGQMTMQAYKVYADMDYDVL